MKQSDAELREHLREQVGFILASVDAFHKGRQSEAKRMAAAIRLLVHDTRHSRSLLSQLAIKNRILFYDTAKSVTDPRLASALNLAGFVLSMGTSGPQAFWTPDLDPGPNDKDCSVRPFHSWWTRPVIKDNHGVFFSRKAIVLGVADQDGGAHVDQDLREAYWQLTRGSSIGWLMDTGHGPEEMPGLELACVRQVAHELLVTLACQAPQAYPTSEAAALYASHLIETKGGSLDIEVKGARPPLTSLPRERLDNEANLEGEARNAPCPCGSGEKYKHCHGL
ncbi:hypothetical protein SMC1_09310 [Candidatus Cryosericum septentrionale]|jgi:hypothetical protein|uniref:SEC-C domain-containing protein n=2 Tax=Candidatus Cryosericum septentrionale TaxID=2290913 RepID=A0A398DJZ9_9BACT|nr:hypothetical protein SMC1_09310 [Candidatus Cryosericum septentrionale]